VKITCFAFDAGGRIRPEAEATVVSAWRAGDGPYWIEIEGGAPEAVTAWLAGLGLDAGLLDELQIGDGVTRFLPLGELLFVGYPVPAPEEGEAPVHFGVLCLDRLVITMHEERVGHSMLDEGAIGRLKLPEATTAGVVCALVLFHSARLRRQVVALRKKGDALAGSMDTHPQTVALEAILALKHRVLALGGLVDEELAALEVLKACNRAVLPLGPLADTFQTVVETTRATDRDIDRLDRRVGDLQKRYESAQQDETNRRLGLLTILSAIFMPLTLLAGVWGMNFEVMPELRYRYGYPLALGSMALVAGGLYWSFRSRGWLK
jgi:Mg2+ and Co2+ transporter CorA